MLIQNILNLLLTMVCRSLDRTEVIYIIFNLISVLGYGIGLCALGGTQLSASKNALFKTGFLIVIVSYGTIIIVLSLVGSFALFKENKRKYFIVDLNVNSSHKIPTVFSLVRILAFLLLAALVIC
nr:hypothetical transcript [Hymenolepis microstoma]